MKELTKSEYDRHFTPSGNTVYITRYLEEWVGEALRDDFELKYCDKGRYWSTEWEDCRRSVIHLSAEKGGSYQIWWGYNHDFIPRVRRDGRLEYYRTDRAVTLDLFDDYGSHTDAGENTYMYYELPGSADDVSLAREWVTDTVKRNIPFMKEWFGRVHTLHDETAEIDGLINSGMTDIYGWRYTKAFLLAKMGDIESAERTIADYYGQYQVPDKLTAKLRALAKG